MIKYKEVKSVSKIFDEFICGKCGKTIKADDEMQLQETYSIYIVGGYDSVFGDGVEVTCNLCQECLYELIGKYCRYNEKEI